jgi:hypothetical protein
MKILHITIFAWFRRSDYKNVRFIKNQIVAELLLIPKTLENKGGYSFPNSFKSGQ